MSIESRCSQYGVVFTDWHIQTPPLGTGSGGKSAVFELYRDSKDWREYSALKVISLIEEQGKLDAMPLFRQAEYSTAVQQQIARAKQEVQLMEQLRGKTNIVGYLDHTYVDWSDENGFGVDLLIRMEKLSDLRGELNKGRFFTEEEIIRIGRDICQALVICHGKNIVHRDIKPENIFFNTDGDYKLGDFGVSRVVGESPSALASTGIGTYAYSAPEQFSGAYDKRVDIYSLGLVLYEMCNGNRLPFARSSYINHNEIQTRLDGKLIPAPVSQYNSAPVSSQLTNIVLTACAFKPENRYSTAEEMLLALKELDSTYSPASFRPNPYQNVPVEPFISRDSYKTEPAEPLVSRGPYKTEPAEPLVSRDSYKTEPAEPLVSQEPYQTEPAGPDSPINHVPEDAEDNTIMKNILPIALIGILLLFGFFLLFRHNHTWTDATCLQPKTCIECGKEEGYTLDHIWIDATCTAPKTCSVCLTTVGSVLEHCWIDATCTMPQTCESCGETFGDVLEHRWIDATCAMPQTCESCGETFGDVLEHVWTEATCTESQTCSRCGVTRGKPLDHQWSAATFIAPMTCKVCNTTTGTAISYQDINFDSHIQLIKDVYKDTVNKVQSGEYRKQSLGTGITAYYDSKNNVMGIDVIVGVDGIGQYSSTYSRRYYFLDERLIFAAYEGAGAQRFYFYDELLIRWISTSSSNKSTYYDFDFSDEYFRWEALVLEEAAALMQKAK